MAALIKAVKTILGLIDDIELGCSRGFDPQGLGRHSILVVRTGKNSFYAYQNSCPHSGYEQASMAWKKHQFLSGNGEYIQCGSHGALFEIATGQCISGPCIGESLAPVKVQCDNDGQLFMELTNERDL